MTQMVYSAWLMKTNAQDHDVGLDDQENYGSIDAKSSHGTQIRYL